MAKRVPAVSYMWDVTVSLLLVIIKTFNRNIKSTVMEMALTEIFLFILCEQNKKMPFFSLVTFITTLQCNI